jgi:hypothetical protein
MNAVTPNLPFDEWTSTGREWCTLPIVLEHHPNDLLEPGVCLPALVRNQA